MSKRHLRPGLEMLEGKALLSAAIGLAPHVAVQRAPSTLSKGSVIAVLTTDRRVYHPGQSVTLTLKLTNPTSQDLSIVRGPSLNGFYATQRGVKVWSSNSGIQPMWAMNEVIPPHGSITLTATWNGSSLQGATGVFQLHSQVPSAKPVTIRIQPH